MSFKSVICISVLLLTAACGWTPVYLKTEQNASVVDETAQIRVARVPEETGRILVRTLNSNLNPDNTDVPKKYELSIHLSETVNSDQGILGDNTATRATMRLTAAYTLKDLSSQQVLLSDTAYTVSSYNILTAPYATLTAEQTTRRRLAELLADSIALRMANYFKGKQKP